jgi:TRAP-type C4-dicarboxylate transport system permease small subunit
MNDEQAKMEKVSRPLLFARGVKKGILLVAQVLNGIGTWVLVILALIVVAEVFTRRVLNNPFGGSRLRASIVTAMYFLSAAMLGVATWQLLVQAMLVMRRSQTSGILEIPIFPFLFIGTFGIFLLALVYLVRAFDSLNQARRGK